MTLYGPLYGADWPSSEDDSMFKRFMLLRIFLNVASLLRFKARGYKNLILNQAEQGHCFVSGSEIIKMSCSTQLNMNFFPAQKC